MIDEDKAPAGAKTLVQVNLRIRPEHPLVFDIEVPPGKLVFAFGHVEKGKIVGARQPAALVPCLVFECLAGEPTRKRRVALVPAGGGWIGEPSAELLTVFQSPIDGRPIAIYEVDIPAADAVVVDSTQPDVLAAISAARAANDAADQEDPDAAAAE